MLRGLLYIFAKPVFPPFFAPHGGHRHSAFKTWRIYLLSSWHTSQNSAGRETIKSSRAQGGAPTAAAHAGALGGDRYKLLRNESGQQSTLDDACIAALVENLSLETLSIDENHTLTSEAVEIILRSPTAQTLSYGQFFRVDAFTSANILRLVRGCPKLVDLLWHLDCDRHVDGQNVEDLLALLKDRGKGNPDQYVEVDVL